MALMVLAEKLCPHSSSVMALTFRVETPCTYISASAAILPPLLPCAMVSLLRRVKGSLRQAA